MILLGLAVSQGKFDLPLWTAYVLIVLGMADSVAHGTVAAHAIARVGA